MHIFVIGALSESIVNFRGELIKSMISEGHKVTALAGKADPAIIEKILKLGANFIEIPISRTSLNPFVDIKTFFAVIQATRRCRPDIILAYTIKPVVWGGIAARLLGVRFYAIITGLGYAFNGIGFKRKLVRGVASFLYSIALKSSEIVFFQNIDNRDVFLSKKIILIHQSEIIDGSGVDSNFFQYSELPKTNFTFLCVCRLLKEKGLREYAEAAKTVMKSKKDVVFLLVGPVDNSPDSISSDEVFNWVNSGYLQYKGEVSDVREYIRQSHVFVLPSYHEGIPRSILEAMAMGRPILTTNAVGCKETVLDEINGFKVPIKSADALAEKMIWFIENKNRLSEMGKKSRELIEKKFEVKIINQKLMRSMQLIGI